eukprot:COSAG06_NODE_51029_length_314_cov_2.386047_1_plen_55_part_10
MAHEARLRRGMQQDTTHGPGRLPALGSRDRAGGGGGGGGAPPPPPPRPGGSAAHH